MRLLYPSDPFNKALPDEVYAEEYEAVRSLGVATIAERIDSPFFSVDIILSKEGQHRLIELGDGQVSDRKKWLPERFASMLQG